jgi:Na+/H+-dicarboxylate symporter
MNPALQVFLAFVAGLGAGIVAPSEAVLRALEPLGTLWISALRMPILPLIVMLTIAGVTKARDTREAGALTGRAIATFLVLLLSFTAIMTTLAPLLLAGLPLDPAATAALRGSASVEAVNAGAQLTVSSWVISLVPTNPIKAAADGALLPLVVFALLYGLALTRLPEDVRRRQGEGAQGIADVLIVMIRWVLLLAPIGVFALAYGLGVKVGAPAAAAVAHYLVVTSLAIIVAGAVLCAITLGVGRVTPKAFFTAIGPALVIALSSRSSLAALPVLITGIRQHLRLPEPVIGVVVPLAASLFKFNAAITWALGAVFVSALYGVPLHAAQLLTFGVGTVLLSLTTPGIPSGGFLVQAPLYLAVGLPVEGLGILIAIDLIPDLFKTAINVTGYASAAVIVARGDGLTAEPTKGPLPDSRG